MTVYPQGLCRLRDGVVTVVDADWPGPTTVLVSSEQVTLTTVALPFPTRARRVAAAPFALEELIAEPLSEVHVAVGVETAPGRHLCGVVRHGVLRGWLEDLDRAGVGPCVVMPDALALPTPPERHWRVAVADGRAVVRTADAGGFATEPALLPVMWEAAGRPLVIASGDPLPEVMRAGLDEATLRLDGAAPRVMVPPLDLRQGVYAAPTSHARGPLRVTAALVAAGVAAHLAIALIDLALLDGMADRREAETRALVAARDGALAQQADLAGAVDRLAPVAAGGEGPMVRALGRTAAALAGRPITYRAISLPGAGQGATLQVSAPDMATVEAAAQALSAGGAPTTAALDPVAEAGASIGGVNAVLVVAGEGR